MARKNYQRSEETYYVLNGHEADIAKEMECNPSYIYGIKDQHNPDPFPKFRELFRASANADADVHIWLNDLQSIALRAEKSKVADFYTALINKVETDAESTERILESLKDGEIDAHECRKIGATLEKMKANLLGLERLLRLKLKELDEQSNVRVM